MRRSDAPSSIPGVESLRADARDEAAAIEAVRGATAVYHCMNVAYFAAQWAAELPPILESLINAAGRARARLVVLDNLYAFGRPAGRKLNEETLFNPCSRKGEIRARLHLQLAAAVQRGDVQAVTGRASDFYGPGGVGTHFADRFWPAALAGKPVSMVVPLETPHTYHFIPDVAVGLAALGQDPSAAGTFMLPCQPVESTGALVRAPRRGAGAPHHGGADVAAAAGRARPLHAHPARAARDGLPVGGAVRGGRRQVPRPLRRPRHPARRGGAAVGGLGAGGLRRQGEVRRSATSRPPAPAGEARAR